MTPHLRVAVVKKLEASGIIFFRCQHDAPETISRRRNFSHVRVGIPSAAAAEASLGACRARRCRITDTPPPAHRHAPTSPAYMWLLLVCFMNMFLFEDT